MNILIVDDHPLTCQGLAALLGGALAQAHVRCAHDVARALLLIEQLPAPDWIFLDLNLPDDPEHRLYAHLCLTHGIERCVLISADPSHALIRDALAAGARGFIAKSADPQAVLDGFARIRAGAFYLPPEWQAQPDPTGAARECLSPRLQQVQALLLRGLPNKLIARELGLSEHTVKEYCSSVLAYYGVANRLELVLRLRQTPAG